MEEKATAKPKRQIVPGLEKLSYAQLDFAGQLVATVVGSYLMYFFTDVVLLPAAAAG